MDNDLQKAQTGHLTDFRSFPRHPFAQILVTAFWFLRDKFGVDRELYEEVCHFSDTPRKWYTQRLAQYPVEIAYSDALQEIWSKTYPGGKEEWEEETTNTWERYAALRIGPIGSLFEDSQESDTICYPQSFMEILAGPWKASIFNPSAPAHAWDIRLDSDSGNELSRHSLGAPYMPVFFTALATIATCMLEIDPDQGIRNNQPQDQKRLRF